jgi:hypothetical protein
MGIVSMSCIIGLARTSRWTKMRRIHAVCNSPMRAASSPFPKWAGCTTGTNAGQPEEGDTTRQLAGNAIAGRHLIAGLFRCQAAALPLARTGRPFFLL